MIIILLANAFLLSFIMCCIFSAVLQIRAWTRHAKEGIPVSLRALWKPEGSFDEVGLHQIKLARTLLTVGAFAYLMYGGLVVVSAVASQ
jgi:hypothetical protein